MCSLAWTMIRRYMPSTVASLLSTLTLRRRSAAFRPARAVLTASSERFNQLITSGFAVTVFSMSGDVRSAGILGPVILSKWKFASAMCLRTSLVDRTPGAGRHANFSAGIASASATSCRETWTHSPAYPCQTHLLHHVGGSYSFPAGCNFENGLVTRFLST